MKPKAALWKRDWQMTPAAHAYRDLVFNEWWTHNSGRADAQGKYRTRAFYGRYSVESGGKRREVVLTQDRESVTVRF